MTQPRREIARASELLQAQLLQDININPVQPSLSATNLNIFARGGPASPGFNEFTPLFQRNQAQLNLSGLAGSDSTYGGEAVVSGLYDRLSVSAGQFHYESDGFRRNADTEQKVYVLFGQAALTPRANVQAEVLHLTAEEGDIRLDFDPDAFSGDRTRDLDKTMVRLGGRFSPSSRSAFITSLIYGNRHAKTQDVSGTGTPFDIRANQHGFQGEVQHVFRGNAFNAVAGFSGYTINTRDRVSPLGAGSAGSSSRSDDQNTAYAYSTWFFPKAVAWTFGLSYDYFNRDGDDRFDYDVTRVSPKLGIQWTVSDTARFRFAAFQTIKPALFANRTIQPTQVAGFNQFYDGFNGTTSWNYGAALDTRLARKVYGGLEAVSRDLDVPAPRGGGSFTEDMNEQNYQAYIYWVPTSNWALRFGTAYDVFDSNSPTATGGVTKVETLSFPVEVRYFSPGGFFAGFGASLVHQDVSRGEEVLLAEGNDAFVVADGLLGYRFPQRRGLVTLEARNLFDQGFKLQDNNYRIAQDLTDAGPLMPERSALARMTLNF